MSKPEFSRPFNLEHAKAGAPYGCRNGVEATILKFDRRDEFAVLGMYGNADQAISWMPNGQHARNSPEGNRDLVMLPLGFIDGKPVWVGDEVVSGQAPYGDAVTIAATHDMEFGDGCGWRWPAPAPVYPETLMTRRDFARLDDSRIFEIIQPSYEREARLIANAALRHAIDAGQVVLPGAAPSDDLLMKVAKEVYCRATGQEHFINEKEQYFRSIIASVTGAKDAKEGAK